MRHIITISHNLFQHLQNLDEDAASKAQRRLFGMALAYKRGKLDPKYASKDIKKISELPEKTIKQFAKTFEKKRKSNGTIGKRDALPNYTREGKNYKTLPKKYIKK